jgi:LCP family protein required for cell wall assembly
MPPRTELTPNPVADTSPSRARQKKIVAFAIGYVVIVLTVAVAASSFFYDWARVRILATSPLSAFTDTLALAPITIPKPVAEPQIIAPIDNMDASDVEVVNIPAPSIPAINILLLGTDARPGEGAHANTDTMILLTLDPQSQTAGLLSLPRDLYVPLPGYGYNVKINTAYRTGEMTNYPNGGAQLAKDTVSSFIGEPVHYYVRVNFRGFVDLIDMIGGVEMVVPKTIYDPEFPTDDFGYQTFYLEAGPQRLDGETALKYVRTRNVDDDYGRARRQQEVLAAVARQVTRADMITTLLPKVAPMLYTMRSSIDTDVPMQLQLELANYFASAPLRPVRQLVLDSQFGYETYTQDGMWILMPDRARVRPAVATFFEPPSIYELNEMVAGTNTDWIRIEILNGTGEPGVAARTRDMLVAQGWQVVSIGDAYRSDYGQTIIVNYGVPEELVARVGVDLELEPSMTSLNGLNVTAPVDVRIVVGRDILTHLK